MGPGLMTCSVQGHSFPLKSDFLPLCADPGPLLFLCMAGPQEVGEGAAAVRLAQRLCRFAGSGAAVFGSAGYGESGQCAGARLLQEHR